MWNNSGNINKSRFNYGRYEDFTDCSTLLWRLCLSRISCHRVLLKKIGRPVMQKTTLRPQATCRNTWKSENSFRQLCLISISTVSGAIRREKQVWETEWNVYVTEHNRIFISNRTDQAHLRRSRARVWLSGEHIFHSLSHSFRSDLSISSRIVTNHIWLSGITSSSITQNFSRARELNVPREHSKLAVPQPGSRRSKKLLWKRLSWPASRVVGGFHFWLLIYWGV